MTNVNLREVVLDILLELEKEGTFSHLVITSALNKYQYLDKQQRSFITRTAQGTIERKLELDYIIDQFSKTPVRKMKPLIRCLLRMSVYQLQYMDSVPASAVCNEAVKLAVKRKFVSLRGFVNGVLRNISRNLDQVVYPDPVKEPLKYLSVKYSIPEWILSMWKKNYSKEQIVKILEGFAQRKKTYIRCNTGKVTMQELREHLEAENVTVNPVEGLSYAYEISGYDYLADLNAFQKGEFQIQDISSMLAGEAAAPKAHDYVVDVCAAPGGKSINVALMIPDGKVLSRDLTDYKVSMIESNADRLEIDNLTAQVWDATEYDPTLQEQADIVIADLPCSGLGIIGRKPDIKYHATEQGLKDLAQLQRTILSEVWQYVKPGGYLIFSTCTINRGENEENTEWFLKEYPFELCDLTQDMSECLSAIRSDITSDKGAVGIQLLPGIDGTDGFYIAKLRRK